MKKKRQCFLLNKAEKTNFKVWALASDAGSDFLEGNAVVLSVCGNTVYCKKMIRIKDIIEYSWKSFNPQVTISQLTTREQSAYCAHLIISLRFINNYHKIT